MRPADASLRTAMPPTPGVVLPPPGESTQADEAADEYLPGAESLTNLPDLMRDSDHEEDGEPTDAFDFPSMGDDAEPGP
jgi:hypothetical protein